MKTVFPLIKNLFLLLLFPVMDSAAQQDVRITLVVNNKEKLAVYHDEPLLLSLFLSNPLASANEQWNYEASLGIVQLEKQFAANKIDTVFFQQEKQRLQNGIKEGVVMRVGSDLLPLAHQVQFYWLNKRGDTTLAPLKLLSDDSTTQLLLNANTVYLLEWGRDRAAMQKTKDGNYRLMATIGNYRSNVVELQIRPQNIPVALLQTTGMQLVLGRFALQYGQTAEAVQYAKNILKKVPFSVEGWVLLGDAFIQKNAYGDARKIFEAALQSYKRKYPHSPEPPEYILSMINWLKEKE